jgi:hypothetical protein
VGLLILGLLVTIALALRIHGLDTDRSAMIAAAKADGVLPADFPANCGRMLEGTTWGTLDYEPASNQSRCNGASRKLLIVLHKVRGSWHVAGSTTAFPSRAGCRIAGIPPAVQAGIAVCYLEGTRVPASDHGLP